MSGLLVGLLVAVVMGCWWCAGRAAALWAAGARARAAGRRYRRLLRSVDTTTG